MVCNFHDMLLCMVAGATRLAGRGSGGATEDDEDEEEVVETEGEGGAA